MVDIAQFKANFGKHKVPDELLKLCQFQEATGFENLSDGFCLTEAEESGGLSNWSESKLFLDSVIEFAQANGSGSIYALWLMEPKGELSKQPVIVLGDEGGAHVVAENLKDFLRLLTLDTEPMVDWDEVSFYRDPDEYEPSEDLDEYIDWLDYTFNLKPIKNADEILRSTRKKYDKKFKQWASKFIEDIEVDEDDDDDEEENGGESSAKRRFEFEEGNSSKFWEIQLDGESLTTWWGKIGTAGQSKTLDFDSEEEAKKQYDKLVAEKTKKGYEEVGSGAGDVEEDDDEDDAPPPRAKAAPPSRPAAKPAAPPAKKVATTASASGGSKRHFEFEEGNSSKFWEIQLNGESLTTWWGKLGTAGQSKTLDFNSEDEAKKQYDKLVAEKTKKGYEEVGGSGTHDVEDDEDEEDDDEDTAPPPRAKAAAPAKSATKPASSPKKEVVVPANASSGSKRHFEFEEGNSSKFWDIQLDGDSLTTWWGKLGTAGQSKTLNFASEAEAQKQYDKLVVEKTKKGYEESGNGSSGAPHGGGHDHDDDGDDYEEEEEDDDDDAPPARAKVAAPMKAAVKTQSAHAKPSTQSTTITSAPAGDKRRFEFEEGSSSKFWEIQLGHNSLTTWWGKIGTAGQSKTLSFGSNDEAQKQYDKLVAEKTKKGYEEVD